MAAGASLIRRIAAVRLSTPQASEIGAKSAGHQPAVGVRVGKEDGGELREPREHAAHEVPAGVVDVLRLDPAPRRRYCRGLVHQRHVDVAGVAGHLVERLGHEGDAAAHLHRRLLHGGAEEMAVVAHLAHGAGGECSPRTGRGPTRSGCTRAPRGLRPRRAASIPRPGTGCASASNSTAARTSSHLVLAIQEEELELGRAA